MREDIEMRENTSEKLKKCIVFEPKTQLKEKVSGTDANFVFDAEAIQKAEKALEDLSENFDDWLKTEVLKIDKAKNELLSDLNNRKKIETLSRASHDLKGHAKTFGYPIIEVFCISLCNLLDNYPVNMTIPDVLIQQHVDAIKAIINEQVKTTSNDKALKLIQKLQFVTNQCIIDAKKKTLS